MRVRLFISVLTIDTLIIIAVCTFEECNVLDDGTDANGHCWQFWIHRKMLWRCSFTTLRRYLCYVWVCFVVNEYLRTRKEKRARTEARRFLRYRSEGRRRTWMDGLSSLFVKEREECKRVGGAGSVLLGWCFEGEDPMKCD